MTLAVSGMVVDAHAQQAFSGAWFAAKGAVQNTAAQTGRLPNGQPVSSLNSPSLQQQQANAQLQRSINNLGVAAQSIAAQQAWQAAARQAARNDPSVPDGLAEGGLKVDADSLTKGWLNANAPMQTVAEGRTTVGIQQTADKAILNWETFNVGKNTTVAFQQQKDWAVLNRVNDPNARPSQIQGQIKGDGTVLIANRNGIVFSGSSQIDTRNLVAAAANISNDQFQKNGLYSAQTGSDFTPSFTDAQGKVEVKPGAQITTRLPTTVTEGGGYVLLLGREVHNAGALTTANGQAALAAGDSFVIRKGVGTNGNQNSSARGNEVAPSLGTIEPDSTAGTVSNSGLIYASTGDVTLAGHQVKQDGVVLSTSSVNGRGTIHLLNSASDQASSVTLSPRSVTAVLVDSRSATALDAQRDALIRNQTGENSYSQFNDDPLTALGKTFDNLSTLADRRDLSRVEIVSGGTVDFQGDSLTLATGGQVAVAAGKRTLVAKNADIDVSGAVGVQVAMESNNIRINVQGNEQRDVPNNRDGKRLNNTDLWIDRRSLVYVAPGVGGYANARWYTSGGLLEVGGYLGTMGHDYGEWAAQGGTVQFAGNEVITQQGSRINLSGGTLEVQTGFINQSWLKGPDGQLHEVSKAPGDILYAGLYKGFEDKHARWGEKATAYFYNPLIGPQRRLESGYTAGRDAGRLVVSTTSAILEGDIEAKVYQGPRQTQAHADLVDSYKQSQNAVARPGQLIVGRYDPVFDVKAGELYYNLGVTQDKIVFDAKTPDVANGLALADELPEDRKAALYLNTDRLNRFGLGGITVASKDIVVADALAVAPGGAINLYGGQVAVNADLTARSGTITANNTIRTLTAATPTIPTQLLVDTIIATLPIDPPAEPGAQPTTRPGIAVAEGATLDARGLWTNLITEPEAQAGLGYVNGGKVTLRQSRDGDIVLGQGSLIDVSSGAVVLANSKIAGGKGGDVELVTNSPVLRAGKAFASGSLGQLVLGADLRGYGMSGAGTLTSVTGQEVQIGGESDTALKLGADWFQKGFARYQVTGLGGMTVAAGTTLDVARPVFLPNADAWQRPTGLNPAQAMQTWLPPLYLEDPQAAKLTRRAGASLALRAGDSVASMALRPGLVAQVDAGAVINVDPGQSIEIGSLNQLTVDGTLNAWGGEIRLSQYKPAAQIGASGIASGRSIWIGEHARLDAAARPATAIDAYGRSYGLVPDGGSIVIGGQIDHDTGSTKAVTGKAPEAFVIVRPGAVLDASGAQAELDVPGSGRTTVASNGGSIALVSYHGLYVDGDLRARAGGAGAAGGTLSMAIEAPEYGPYYPSWDGTLPPNSNVNDRVLTPRELIVAQAQGGSVLGADLRPGVLSDAMHYGAGRLGVDRIQAGGFDNVALLSNGIISFDGNVSLALRQSLQLYAGSLALSQSSAGDARVDLSAPYVRLAGPSNLMAETPYYMHFTVLGGASKRGTQAQLRIAGDLIDVRNSVTIGASGVINGLRSTPGGAANFDWRGFEETELVSGGDIRFLKSVGLSAGGSTASTELLTPGNLTLTAAQLYPTTHAQAMVLAGYGEERTQYSRTYKYDPTRTLTISRSGDANPALPYSVFGRLTLGAATINQGGIVRAPLGQLMIGTFNESLGYFGSGGITNRVNLLPGSTTSVSAAGLIMPYGGTVDGVRYTYNDKGVAFAGVGSPNLGQDSSGSVLTLGGQSIRVEAGAVLDLSGGGELTGAGFVSGRGGSTDARYVPLIQIGTNGGFKLPGLDTNPVYALVPGAQPRYAPVAAERGAVDPQIGRQVTIGAGVPGLPAGIYTLMPSTYALLPGAFRVEVNGLAASNAPNGARILRNGSYAVSAQLGTANTAIRDAWPSEIILTPAHLLRSYSQYNETSYADFAVADAVRASVPRPELPADGKTFMLTYPSQKDAETAFSFEGTGRFAPATGGFGGSLVLSGGASRIELLAAGAKPAANYSAYYVDDINAVGAVRVMIGGGYQIDYTDAEGTHKGANYAGFRHASASEIVLREGATLSVPEVFLVSTNLITIEPGASINTVGRGKGGFDATDGFVYAPVAMNVLAVSNGRLQMLSPSSDFPLGNIQIGTCAQAPCASPARLYSEGSIVVAAQDQFALGADTRLGTRRLVLGLPTVNIGSDQGLVDATARGILPSGLMLSQDLLGRLVRGDTSKGAPALEELELTAGNSFNFFGTTSLNTLDLVTGRSHIERLILSTPAIYGYGAVGDVARIDTGTLVWNGATSDPGAVVAGGAGSGSGALQINAKRIEFGYGPFSQPDTLGDHGRLALGFADVTLNASDRITANHKGHLMVYRSQGDYVAGKGYQYSGGNLHLVTPLLTGEAGSINHLAAGGAITARAPAGASPPAAGSGALGAELSLTADRIAVDTTIALPSGKLTLAATQDVALQDGASIDMAGRAVAFNDIIKYSWGGDVVLLSELGNITQAAGATIDLSAAHNRAGVLKASALDAGAGVIDLQGKLLGSASGEFDAGGTYVPYDAATVELRGQRIENFAALNQRLNEGGVFGARRFQTKQGSLSIGSEVKAREIEISVDGGSLTVAGTIDASGAQVGSIRLAARDSLTLQGGSVLDAHGARLRVDSYGKIIDSPNRAIVELNARSGRLALLDGAVIDLRHGTDVAVGTQPGQNDGRARGTLEMNAQRVGGARGNDIAIDVAGNLDIRGARSIAVSGVQRYDDAAYGTGPAASGRPYQVINQAYLDAKNDDSQAFMANLLGNDNGLQTRLAGLRRYEDAFHLRPGVEIVSKTGDGDLVVQGDLDLSGYRYASVNPHAQKTAIYGSGEPGSLVLRAGGNLDIYGSINDGFAPPDTTQDTNGWLLNAGKIPFGGELVVPEGNVVTLAAGTQFRPGVVLNYDVPLLAGQIAKGVRLPVTATLNQTLTLAAGTVLSGDVLDAANVVLYKAGTLLGEPVILQPGAKLGAGTVVPQSLQIQSLTWPSGVALPGNGYGASQEVLWNLAANVLLPMGALIPSDTVVALPVGVTSVQLRTPVGGRQGANWAVAKMLPEGSQSWSMRLVGGADTAAAGTRMTRRQQAQAGNVRLADTHYGVRYEAPGVLFWTDAGADEVGLPRGTQIDDEWIGLLTESGLIDDPYYVIKKTFGEPVATTTPNSPALSVLRTGTGDLDLVAAGSFHIDSPYGVYTAGTPSASLVQSGPDPYNQPRGKTLGDTSGTVLGQKNSKFESLVDGGTQSLYQAWYPEQGGNLLLRTGGDVTGDNWASLKTLDGYPSSLASSGVGNWLWRQGGGSTPTAWWINFGTYAAQTPYNQTYNLSNPMAYQAGFVGIGTLGGGNLTVDAGGSLGTIDVRGLNAGQYPGQVGTRSQGLVLAVGSTGRVGPDGKLVLTGGGDMDVRVSGYANPNAEARSTKISYHSVDAPDLDGVLVNLRGNVRIETGAIGGVDLRYKAAEGEIQGLHPYDKRAFDPFTAGSGYATGGWVVMPGDATVSLNTRGDLVLAAAGDPGRVPQSNATPFSKNGIPYEGGLSWFSLWTDRTAIDLFSAGGNLTPITTPADGQALTQSGMSNYLPSDGRYLYPSILRAVAASGSFYYGNAAGLPGTVDLPYGLLLAPSASGKGQLEFLAGDSIYAAGMAVSQSGAQPSAMATPFKPGFIGLSHLSSDGRSWSIATRNDSGDGIAPYLPGSSSLIRYPLFTFGPNSAADGEAVAWPARFYAVEGDIVGLRTGSILKFNGGPRAGQTWYEGGPVRIMAGRDIINAGNPLGVLLSAPAEMSNGAASSGDMTRMSSNLIVNGSDTDISVISAGRDILYSNFNIAGPGLLEVTAGRNLLQEDKAALNSIGPIGAAAGKDGGRAGGAGITVSAGLGEHGANYAGFAQRYLDPVNQAESGLALAEQAGKVAKTYERDLAEWLTARFGFAGRRDEAQAYFMTLPSEQQRVFVRQVYFAELKASGREYTDASGPRAASYLRGRQAVAGLFPNVDEKGRPIAYKGDVLVHGDAGIQTQFGGDIQVLTPGGAQTYGREGEAPPAKLGTPGVITLGSGNIQMYSLDSILLGQSRIMTTFGGYIQAWSAEGDINAGRGSKTTLVYTPPKREYDAYGNVRLSPVVPSTGAGIATLNPIPEVPPGDIDLTAPLGTIDAGEAGIRVSGNVNFAALQVVNAANVQVQGKATGIPTVAAVNVGALTNASAAASAAATAAQDTVQRARAEARQNLPSIFTVRVLGFGNEVMEDGDRSAPPSSSGRQSGAVRYDSSNLLQLVGNGRQFDPKQVARLTEEERRALQSR
ncbi:filamentous hemagglutinin family protein [Cupriavidus basilensis]|uniref:Filamentous hemagglutinin family protein n=1 Tax=Cupriavidus basilensis TaxID=68895 RepID=A0ABT6AYC0_9BURK|nr:filamentous haemagglutinin family protein [Cupriavidus basilensis]MDF3837592.1 filamentous hemagglutinin family protein [Cupriavidus basilensis]